MSPDNQVPEPGGRPRDISEEELRSILGDDYDAVAGPPDPVAAGVPAGGAPGGGLGSPADSTGIGSDPLTPNMTPQEADAWARQMERELDQNSATPGPMVQPVQFGQLESSGRRVEESIEVLLDVKLPISVELGRTEMLVKEILECGPGTVIELNKLAGEPVDIFVNGRLVAQGEVVVVDEHFGVRVTNLLSPRDRVKSLA